MNQSLSSFLEQHYDGQSTSLETFRRMLDYLETYMDAEGLTIELITRDQFKEYLEAPKSRGKPWANGSQRNALAAAKCILRFMGYRDEADRGDEDYHSVLRLKVPKVNPPQGRMITPDQIPHIIDTLEQGHSFQAIREKALTLFYWSTGVRKMEAAMALLEKLEFKTIEVKGKTYEVGVIELLTKASTGREKQWELKAINEEAKIALKAYLRVRGDQCTPENPYLFVPQFCAIDTSYMDQDGVERIRKANHGELPLTEGGIGCIFKRIGHRLGYKISPHDFRRGAAVESKRRNVNDQTIMDQFGWSNPEMLRHYTRVISTENYLKAMINGNGK